MSDAKPIILVVEDDADLRRLFHMALALEGFAVLEAADGYEALIQLEAHRVDLAVLDLRLPRVGGLTVHQEIEARAANARIPVIVVTGSPEDLQSANVHPDCVLRKPVLPPDLVRAVRNCLRSGTLGTRR